MAETETQRAESVEGIKRPRFTDKEKSKVFKWLEGNKTAIVEQHWTAAQCADMIRDQIGKRPSEANIIYWCRHILGFSLAPQRKPRATPTTKRGKEFYEGAHGQAKKEIEEYAGEALQTGGQGSKGATLVSSLWKKIKEVEARLGGESNGAGPIVGAAGPEVWKAIEQLSFRILVASYGITKLYQGINAHLKELGVTPINYPDGFVPVIAKPRPPEEKK